MNGNVPSFLLDAITDDGIPDFYVSGITFEQWWENASQSNSFWFFAGIIAGIILGKLLSFLYKQFKKDFFGETEDDDKNSKE